MRSLLKNIENNRIINKKFLELIIVNQKNIMVMLVSIIVTFFVCWFFIYSPKREQTKKIKSQYEAIKKDIKEIESMAGGGTLDASLPLLDKKLKVLEEKLPQMVEGDTLVRAGLSLDITSLATYLQ